MLAFVLIGTSGSFQQCVHERKAHQAYHTLHEKGSVLAKTIVRLELQAICARVSAGENDGAIAAIATIAVAFFTLTLWRATDRLWRSAERQLDAFQTSLDIAHRHADHMEKMAAAAQRSADVAERSLTEHQRPWIFLDVVTVNWRDRLGDDDHRVNDWWISLKWKNVGRSPAMIRQFQFAITDADSLPAEPDYTRCQPDGVAPSLPEGKEFDTRQVGPSQGVKPDGSVIQYVFWGRLLYSEMNRKEHASGFALRVGTHFPAAVEDSREAAYNYYT
jgi:hypothetical protein